MALTTSEIAVLNFVKGINTCLNLLTIGLSVETIAHLPNDLIFTVHEFCKCAGTFYLLFYIHLFLLCFSFVFGRKVTSFFLPCPHPPPPPPFCLSLENLTSMLHFLPCQSPQGPIKLKSSFILQTRR